MHRAALFDWLVGFAILAASPGVALGELAVTLDSFASSNNLDFMVGYRFETSTPITLTDLGKFDIDGSGLSAPAQVGIWDLSRNLIASVTVPAGTGGVAEAAGNYTAYFQPVSPVTLLAGTYVIGAQAFVAETNTFGATVSMASGITYLSGQYNTSNAFAYPSTGAPTSQGYFGPNFQFEAAAAAISVVGYTYDGSGAGATPNASFPDGSLSKLTDGIIPASAYTDPGWVGFRDDAPDDQSSQPQVTFDLGGNYDLATAEFVYLASTSQASGTITQPESILVSVSDDGATFGPAQTFTAAELYSSTTGDLRTAVLNINGLSGSYVRLDFSQTGVWTFLGEASFRGVAVVPEPGCLALALVAAGGWLGSCRWRPRRSKGRGAGR